MSSYRNNSGYWDEKKSKWVEKPLPRYLERLYAFVKDQLTSSTASHVLAIENVGEFDRILSDIATAVIDSGHGQDIHWHNEKKVNVFESPTSNTLVGEFRVSGEHGKVTVTYKELGMSTGSQFSCQRCGKIGRL